MKKEGSLLGGVLMVSGTCIGGGMLALPVVSSLAGFIPSLLLCLLCWIFMACTGLLLLEVSQWVREDANLISMAEETLGFTGKVIAWGMYLFLFYCLTVAYVVGCGALVTDLFGEALYGWRGSLLFILLTAPLVYRGVSFVGPINSWLMVGLGITYCGFIFMGVSFVKSEYLMQQNWFCVATAMPLAFTSFAYQGIVPTLFGYMGRNLRKTRLTILIGSFLPFIVYIVWQWLILGIIPAYGPNGLAVAMQNGQNAIHPLKFYLSNPAVLMLGQWFAFFALTTSFFGVTLGIMDFLADGLQIEKDASGKCLLASLIFFPALFIAAVNPTIFLIALEYAGGFGCAILLGLLPILMVWRGRYSLGYRSEWTLPGGKVTLVLLTFFVLIELAIELHHMIV